MGEVVKFPRSHPHSAQLSSRSEKFQAAAKTGYGVSTALVIAAMIVAAVIGRVDPSLPSMDRLMPTLPGARSHDPYAARFGFCPAGGGVNCVVDGNSFRFGGEKYRIADIDAPQTHSPPCIAKAGDRAARRLEALLNEGPFQLKAVDHDMDPDGRKPRIVLRDGQSLGSMLIREGLAPC